MTVRKGKTGYFYDVRKDGKRIRSKCFSTIKEAREKEAEFLNVPSSTAPTFGNLVEEYLSIKIPQWKESSVQTFIKRYQHITDKLGTIPIDMLTVALYNNFLCYLDDYSWMANGKEKHYSESYKNEIVVCVRSICRYSEMMYGVTTKIPFQVKRYRKAKRQMDYWTIEEFQRFIQEVEDIEYRCFFTFLMYSGCRRGEALALRFSDIDFKKQTVSITKTLAHKVKGMPRHDIPPKTESSIRILPLTEAAFKALLQMRDYYFADGKNVAEWRVFGGESVLDETTIDRKKDAAVKKAGVKRIRVHDFRHSFVSYFISRGADISIVAKYVGHSSVKETLDTYAHFYETRLKNLVKQM